LVATALLSLLQSTSLSVRSRSRRRSEVSVDAGEVYRRFGPSVYGYLRGQRVDDPDDLLGEVFFQISKSLPTFVGDEKDLRQWVFTIARNRVIDSRRRRARQPRTISAAPPERFEPPDDASYAQLVEMLSILTEEQREVIGLRFIADLSLDDVATLTNRSVVAVKAMQHRAIAQLARALDDEPKGDGDG
jgi:RNA polymerase sigma-70 factor (ECF subfamily)